MPGITDENIKEEMEGLDMKSFLMKLSLSSQMCLPSARPVHPRPDLKTFYPEEFYEPLCNVSGLSEVTMDPLDPY